MAVKKLHSYSCDSAKAVVRVNFRTLNGCIGNEERLEINYIFLQFKKLEEQIKPHRK